MLILFLYVNESMLFKSSFFHVLLLLVYKNEIFNDMMIEKKAGNREFMPFPRALANRIWTHFADSFYHNFPILFAFQSVLPLLFTLMFSLSPSLTAFLSLSLFYHLSIDCLLSIANLSCIYLCRELEFNWLSHY